MKWLWLWVTLIVLAFGVLVVSIINNEIFPNAFVQFALRVIALSIIIGIIVLQTRKKIKNF